MKSLTCNNLLQYSPYSSTVPSTLTVISLYSSLIACISAILSIPVLGAGLGGGTGGGASLDVVGVPTSAEVALAIGLLEGALLDVRSGLCCASLESWNVINAVRTTISSPLRSSMSKLSFYERMQRRLALR